MQVSGVHQRRAVGADLGDECRTEVPLGRSSAADVVVGRCNRRVLIAGGLVSAGGYGQIYVAGFAGEDDFPRRIDRHADCLSFIVARAEYAQEEQRRVDDQFAAVVVCSQLEAHLLLVIHGGDGEASVNRPAHSVHHLIDNGLVETHLGTAVHRKHQVAIGCEGGL